MCSLQFTRVQSRGTLVNLGAQTPSRLATERTEEPECLLHLAVQQEVKEEASKTIFNLLVTPILSASHYNC